MQIKGIETYTREGLQKEVGLGGKFVIYQYCISAFIVTFKRPSEIYFIPSGESRVMRGMSFTLISLFLGWWGIPWGPIYTIGSLVRNLQGGQDVTTEVMQSLAAGGGS